MRYYKIIKNDTVVGVGMKFLKWFPTKNAYYYSELETGPECVQDIITEEMFHPDWLPSIPNGAYAVEEATVIMISSEEFDELYALLFDGEDIPFDEDEQQEPYVEPEEESEEPAAPMSISEMRQKIIEQDELINMLTECILEMSEIVYG